MAKSKVGGTRAFIRGRIGSDVYSIGKNGKGARQQVVRSLAEQVSNPRSSSQMFGRMVMSTVMQAVSSLKTIIDHSFDGIPTGQPSISEFIRLNYALVKADATNNPSSGNKFGLNTYQEKGIKVGAYQISKGNAIVPSALSNADNNFTIDLTAATLTVGGLKTALGLTADGYFTCVYIGDVSGAEFFRVRVSTALADTTAITNDNVASLFTIEGSVSVTVGLDGNSIFFTWSHDDNKETTGIIVSDKVDGTWIHNDCVMSTETNPVSNADTALSTYPTGTALFLNGGDL